jgi:hypothetical protein
MRDECTEAIFTTADDQLQGLWGWHRYVEAATNMAAPDDVAKRLPRIAYIMTHEWLRYYDPQEMAKAICQVQPFLLVRYSLLGLVTICEAALFRLNHHLFKLNRCKKVSKAGKLLKWAFEIVKDAPVASPEAAARLPQTCGDLDNVRRLRNCIVHRNGCYDEEVYFKQVIHDGWVVPQYEPDSLRAAPAGEPIFLVTGRFEHFTRSGLEFLHILHNTIQCNMFGHKVPYTYEQEGKAIEWHRILSGRRDVKM